MAEKCGKWHGNKQNLMKTLTFREDLTKATFGK